MSEQGFTLYDLSGDYQVSHNFTVAFSRGSLLTCSSFMLMREVAFQPEFVHKAELARFEELGLDFLFRSSSLVIGGLTT